MNETDRAIYCALKFIAKRNRKRMRDKKHKRVFPEALVNSLLNIGLIGYSTDGVPILTTEGLNELRKLESINKSEWAIGISILALLVSILTFFFSIF